jgi:hypothetical protein
VRALLQTMTICVRRGYTAQRSVLDLAESLGVASADDISLARMSNKRDDRAVLLHLIRKDDMVCIECSATQHDRCRNVQKTGEKTGTWCDCQHMPALPCTDDAVPTGEYAEAGAAFE